LVALVVSVCHPGDAVRATVQHTVPMHY